MAMSGRQPARVATNLHRAVQQTNKTTLCQHYLCRQASTSTAAATTSTTTYSDVEGLLVPKPPSKAWYTGRPALNSFLDTLQTTLKNSRSTLYRQGYLTSISQDVRTLPHALQQQQQHQRHTQGQRWLAADSIASKIGTSKVRLAYYRQITGLLAELQALLPYLKQEGQGEHVEALIKEYARPDSQSAIKTLLTPEQLATLEASQTNGIGGKETNRGYGYLARDTGISYAVGKKKTASARAWVLPLPENDGNAETLQSSESTSANGTKAIEASPSISSEIEPTLGQILINAKPISQYFIDAAERSRILRPFSITESLGKVNVFVLVRGGGRSSQAQAAAVACARAIAARDLSEEQLHRKILSKADLLRRDPRVVERKKTGRPKARKGYTWVKR